MWRHTRRNQIFFFMRNGRVHLNRRGRQFSRLLAAELCASAVVMLDTPCSEVVCRVVATHSIRQFPLHFPYRASSCAITFQLNSTIISTKIWCINITSHIDLKSCVARNPWKVRPFFFEFKREQRGGLKKWTVFSVVIQSLISLYDTKFPTKFSKIIQNCISEFS